MKFDLQRMMIYCDSKQAELETCCDLPEGPVSIIEQCPKSGKASKIQMFKCTVMLRQSHTCSLGMLLYDTNLPRDVVCHLKQNSSYENR